MSVPATRLTELEADVDAALAPKDGIALRLENRRPGLDRREPWQRRQRVQQRAPSEIDARERARRRVPLDIGGRSRATGVQALHVIAVHPQQRGTENRIPASSEAELRELGDAPLPQRDGV